MGVVAMIIIELLAVALFWFTKFSEVYVLVVTVQAFKWISPSHRYCCLLLLFKEYFPNVVIQELSVAFKIPSKKEVIIRDSDID